jgi:hypothetical protein
VADTIPVSVDGHAFCRAYGILRIQDCQKWFWQFLHPGTYAMILVGQYDSPVTRRVAIALHHYGMPFTRDTRSIFGDAAAVGKISPLTRIPALVLDDGEVLIDRRPSVISTSRQAGGADPRHRPCAPARLADDALAQGTLERQGGGLREHFHSPSIAAPSGRRCLGRARAGLDELTTASPHLMPAAACRRRSPR